MRLRTLVCVTSAALVIAGCSSVDLTAPVEDRSTPAPGTSSFLPEQSAQSVPVPAQSQPSHLKAEPQPESSGRTHTVAEGDTIYNISVRYGCNPRELMALNGITDPTTLSIGRELVVPVSRDDGSAPNRAAYEQQANVSEGETLAVGTITTAERPATPEEVVERKAEQEQKVKEAAARGEIEIRWPVQGEVIADFAATGNLGIDIAGNKGDPIMAVLDGTVQYVGNNTEGYGQFVIIRHNIRLPGKGATPLITVYGNASKLLVRINETVRAGQKIAEMGDSDADRVKLRFEIRQGKPLDPMLYLQRRE